MTQDEVGPREAEINRMIALVEAQRDVIVEMISARFRPEIERAVARQDGSPVAVNLHRKMMQSVEYATRFHTRALVRFHELKPIRIMLQRTG